jgi:hypothetical protein
MALMAALLAASVVAQAADRQWQTGVWAKPSIAPAPKTATPYRNYTIDAEKFTLDLQETIAKGQNAIASVPGTPVTFAVENDMVYVKEGEVERALRLIKGTLKLKSYSAAGGGHYIKAIGSGGFTITLEDNSVWDIDPRGLYKTEAWEALQGISIRPTEQNNGFNYEVSDIDTDEVVLGRLR